MVLKDGREITKAMIWLLNNFGKPDKSVYHRRNYRVNLVASFHDRNTGERVMQSSVIFFDQEKAALFKLMFG